MTPSASTDAPPPQMLEALDQDLRQTVAVLGSGPAAPMSEMIAYHLGWTGEKPLTRGKRLRPLLTLLACAAAGGDWRHALPAASAVELIHNFSLVHDDIQDNSAERRGRPTVWKIWGLPQAINTGDALLILSRLGLDRLLLLGTPPSTILQVHRRLDEACLHLTQGQHLDLAFEDRKSVAVAEYLEMIEGKTGALVAAATASGALLASADEPTVEAYFQYGRRLGLAFQMQDDILGIWGEPEVTGKPAGDDLRARKKTLPVLCGLQNSPEFTEFWGSGHSDDPTIRRMTQTLEQAGADGYARALAAEHTHHALGELERASPKGDAGRELRDLTLRLLHRDR